MRGGILSEGESMVEITLVGIAVVGNTVVMCQRRQLACKLKELNSLLLRTTHCFFNSLLDNYIQTIQKGQTTWFALVSVQITLNSRLEFWILLWDHAI